MKTSIGQIVIYNTTEQDRQQLANNEKGNISKQLPAIIVAVWSDVCINLKVFGDAQDDLWKTSSNQGEGEGQWQFPLPQ